MRSGYSCRTHNAVVYKQCRYEGKSPTLIHQASHTSKPIRTHASAQTLKANISSTPSQLCQSAAVTLSISQRACFAFTSRSGHRIRRTENNIVCGLTDVGAAAWSSDGKTRETFIWKRTGSLDGAKFARKSVDQVIGSGFAMCHGADVCAAWSKEV